MTSAGVEVIVPPNITITVTDQNSAVEVTQSQGPTVEINNAPTQTNLWVTANQDPGMTTAGLWVNTNADGKGGITLNLVYDDGS